MPTKMTWEELKSWADSIQWIGFRCEDGGIYGEDMISYYVDDVYKVVKDGRIYQYEGERLTPRS